MIPDNFQENVDLWIKQIRREFSEFADLPSLVNENTENIQHNYELYYELQDEIDEMKKDIAAMKVILMIFRKEQSQKN